MPSNKRQKELARRRAERQAQRRAAERAARRKRRTVLGLSIGGTALGVILLLVLVATLRGDDKDSVNPAASGTPTAAPTPSGPCRLIVDGSENSGGKSPGPPPSPSPGGPNTQKGILVLNKGTVEMSLFAEKAPCTVSSFKHLTAKDYFQGTKCHRQTAYDALSVLQCGDPTGSGSGGPGYRFTDENLPKAGPDGMASYPRGTLAMANAGAGTNGSQFFLVLKDSKLEPKYTIWGQVTKGLDVLDAIYAAGVKDKQQDGAPAQEITIQDFTIS